MAVKHNLLFAFILLGFAAMAQHTSETIDPKARQQWIKDNSQRLEKNLITTEGPQLEFSERPFGDQYYYSCKVNEEGGLLEFEDGSWLFIICHSSHDEDSIGDISLAIDNKGRLYQNLGHICGGIIHFINEPGQPKPSSCKEFISDFKCDTDGELWTKVKVS